MGLFFDENKRHVKKILKIAKKVFALEEDFKKLTDEELRLKTEEFKNRYKDGESLESLLPEAFANVREAASRVLGMRHFDEQIMGGICLFQGRIAEMRTGEGKTLVSTLPAYLSAISGKPVHVVTVNDYLAKRDSEWMGKVHKFLGLSVGAVLAGQSPEEKRKQYECDITYCTNNELGFDYLRDNLAPKKEDRVLRGMHFCIIDEIDSILIDEARTPLIISGQGKKSSTLYTDADRFVKTLNVEEDVIIEEKEKTIRLSDQGVAKAEAFYKIENLGDIQNIDLHHYINNALRANYIMRLDDNYIVSNGEILIVDEFTGRVMQGRRYSNGLHQAIEAKEGVEIKNENQTLATITFQNLFRMYKKLSGMTGTAKTEEAEFNRIYNLDVVTLPTHKPNARIDEPDIVFKTVEAKYRAIIEDVKRCVERKQPVLVGVASVEKSEIIDRLLTAQKIKHVVLNAKNHELESQIVAQAGRSGAVTVATNMAGRGTDILLGGNPEFLAKKEMKDKGYDDEMISTVSAYKTNFTEEELEAKKVFEELLKKNKEITDADKEVVLASGGLRIIGTERHESRRIDNQLRGRSGRQGDKGSSVFYLSLEDDLLRRFGGDRLKSIFNFMKIDENSPFQFKFLARQIQNAQKRIEGLNFTQRRVVLEYDDVMNKQRTIIYDERNKVLDGENVREQVIKMFDPVIEEAVTRVISDKQMYNEWDLDKLNASLESAILLKGTNFFTKELVDNCEVEDVVEMAKKEALRQYYEKAEFCEREGIVFSDLERNILLNAVDRNWISHLNNMQVLREEIGLKGYGQQDPILAYKREGFNLFEKMIADIQNEVARLLIGMRVEKQTIDNLEAEREKRANEMNVKSATIVKQKIGGKKIGRNDPCPCGSGKKYKNCCGKGE